MSLRASVRMLRNGVVAPRAVRRLSIGYDGTAKSVATYLVKCLSGERAEPVFVLGEWGTGKSHLLAFIQAEAVDNAIPVSRVALDARNAPMNNPQQFYPLLFHGLRIGEQVGLRALLAPLFGEPSSRNRLKTFAAHSRAEEIRWPLETLCNCFERGEEIGDSAEQAWAFLLGQDLAWSPYTYKRRQAIARINAMLALIQHIRRTSTVLLMDELETIDQLYNIRVRFSAYAVLHQLTQMRGVWPVLAITDRFLRTVDEDVQRMKEVAFTNDEAKTFLRSWAKKEFEFLRPPEVDEQGAHALAREVTRFYHEAYASGASARDTTAQCVKLWSTNPGKNPRRLIRLVVNTLDTARPLSRGPRPIL